MRLLTLRELQGVPSLRQDLQKSTNRRQGHASSNYFIFSIKKKNLWGRKYSNEEKMKMAENEHSVGTKVRS